MQNEDALMRNKNALMETLAPETPNVLAEGSVGSVMSESVNRKACGR